MTGQRPTHAEIDLNALLHNFEQARKAGNGRCLLAVVKADAYGHGAVPVARTLQKAGADLFGVAMAEEGEPLREAGIERPILLLGGFYPGQEEALLRDRLTPAIFDLKSAQRLNECARSAGHVLPYHLKLDTGMGRVGFRPEELSQVLPALAALESLAMEGVLSHLAVADEPGNAFTDEQARRFLESLGRIRQAGFSPDYIHLSNSAALFSREIPETNLVRPGIALYGALPGPSFAGKLDLRPVMHLRSAVAMVKEIPPGTGVSYGHRFVAKRPTILATIPIGYADGYNRLLSNRAEVLIRGRRAPVTGTVCMDWIMADVSDIPGVSAGDPVTLMGEQGGECIGVQDWADWLETIPYEVFCRIGARVPRIHGNGSGDEL